MKIWKYQLQVTDEQMVAMPAGAKGLAVQVQHGVPCLWALVDPRAPIEIRSIVTVGTGHDANSLADLYYVGTYQLYDGDIVLHVFVS